MKIIKKDSFNKQSLLSLELKFSDIILSNKPLLVIISDIFFEEITDTLKKVLENESDDTLIYFLNISKSSKEIKKYIIEELFSDIYALPAFLLFKEKELNLKVFGVVNTKTI